ncbi:TMM54 protein, partial [Casuarius casuarius]|nr:TMM54 protein [Casuarius casuarius]
VKTGLILIVTGHLTFLAGAPVHGIVLRLVAGPQDTISLQYLVSSITSVVSALLVPGAGSSPQLPRGYAENPRLCAGPGP